MGGDFDFRGATSFYGELGKVVADVVGEGLGVSGGTGAATPDVIV